MTTIKNNNNQQMKNLIKQNLNELYGKVID